MGNVISVLHYGSRSISPEAFDNDDSRRSSESDDESASEKQKENSDIERTAVEVATKPERNETSRHEEMVQFHEELAAKREARRKLIADRANELKSTQSQLTAERRINENLSAENNFLKALLAENKIDIPDIELWNNNRDEIVSDLQSNIAEMEQTIVAVKQQNTCLRSELSELHCALQTANSDNASLNKEIFESRRQIAALKEMVEVSKKMLAIRENQLIQLKEKLHEIEQSFADREAVMLSEDLRVQYEKQLSNIRNLKALYEERARVAEADQMNLSWELVEQKHINSCEIEKNTRLLNQIEELQKEMVEKENIIVSKDDQLGSYMMETKELQKEMAGINNVFTQMLLGFNQGQDLDKLVNRLEEHHDLLRDMAVKEHCSDAASQLPKLLLDLVSQVENEGKNTADNVQNQEDSSLSRGMTSHEEIVGNLPKVWRVLMELLSHQNSSANEKQEEIEKPGSCYKSVQTPSGNVLVPSVSKTYIRLKDLILEKKSLQKEMGKMKQLNSHLENRLQDQERRLCLVSSELTKTWHVVGRLRRHHQQLHTHEKILRYELKQKRKLLTEIKEELEYCREKWDQARRKNDESEVQWQKLRTEFAGRKQKSYDDSVNTSAESGFSDEKLSDDEDSRSTDNFAKADKSNSIKRRDVDNRHDSITDINPLAEGEDPISDIVDITDLPLDDQENESDDNSNTNGDILSETEEQPDGEDIPYADTGPKVKSRMRHKTSTNTLRNASNDLHAADITDENKVNNETTKVAIAKINEANIPLDDSINSIESQYLSRNNLDAASKLISPAQIMENIRLQKDRLLLRDQRMQKLEDNCNNLTKQVIQANKRGKSLTERVDCLNDRAKISLGKCHDGKNEIEEKLAEESNVNSEISIRETEDILKITDIKSDNDITSQNNTANYTEIASTSQETILINPAQILENVRKQNERLAARDRRITTMQNECDSIVDNINNVNKKANDLNDHLTKIHSDQMIKESKSDLDSKVEQQTEPALNCQRGLAVTSTTESLETDTEENERKHIEDDSIDAERADCSELNVEFSQEENFPTQNEAAASSDYEARLLAKEERLKRLEDQAKSLVSKMNNTETKRIKIDYKLQELHKIYGVSEDQTTSSDCLANTVINLNEPVEEKDATNCNQISDEEKRDLCDGE